MLTGAFIFFVITIIMAFYLYIGTNPTLLLIAKIFFYFSLAAFLILLITHFLNSAPPAPEENKNLPI
ncbi:hypothetical protein Lgra_3248 [Legionella gratiana]|uniref:Uncharacterized protein n=1 Tax=Legionella gratiana TaxID=45066 RepID=A0A378JE77_9GAMM|nr:hypothetical protein [Legionella gratiana]KTD06471.1 hypothetical protein Lgra_3248 [Legionella gratiana]STX45291.1 Uncharacterised protein [Legionella gratiana]